MSPFGLWAELEKNMRGRLNDKCRIKQMSNSRPRLIMDSNAASLSSTNFTSSHDASPPDGTICAILWTKWCNKDHMM